MNETEAIEQQIRHHLSRIAFHRQKRNELRQQLKKLKQKRPSGPLLSWRALLPIPDEEIVALFYANECRINKLAETLKAQPDAVSTRLKRALNGSFCECEFVRDYRRGSLSATATLKKHRLRFESEIAERKGQRTNQES